MNRRTTRWTLTALLLVAVAGTAAERHEDAKHGMTKIVATARSTDADALAALLPDRLVEHRSRKEEDVAAWREGFARELAGARDVRVEEADSGDAAVATFMEGGSKKTVRLRWAKDRWILDCAQSWMLSGAFLDRARGRGPVTVKLLPRPDNSAYGESAWSFPFATGKSDDCKNRMSVWFCRYGDLHTVGDNRILETREKRLEKVDGIPADFGDGQWVEPKAGRVYVVHCVREAAGPENVDFWVKLRVTKVSDRSLELEWDLLAAGPGAPPSIHEPAPVPDPQDGADGCDGYCGGKL